MKKLSILLALSAGMLLASCGQRVLSSSSQATGLTSSSQPAPQPSSSEPAPEPSSSEPAPQPSSSDPAPEPSSSDPAPQPSSSESSEPSGELFYFREATWWNAESVRTYISIDGAGISGENPNFVYDFDELLPMTYVSTVRVSAKEYFNYWSYDFDAVKAASKIRIIRAGIKYEDDVPVVPEEIVDYGAVTAEFEPAKRGEGHNMVDILNSAKPAAWQEGAPADASRVVAGVWGTYDPDSDVPYVPGEDSSEDSSEATSTGSSSGEVTEEYALKIGETSYTFVDDSASKGQGDTWLKQFKATGISAAAGDAIVITLNGDAIEPGASGANNNAKVAEGALSVVKAGTGLSLYLKVYADGYDIWMTGNEPEPSQLNTVYFTSNKGWETVNIYAYGGTGASMSWPGVAMTAAGVDDFGQPLFSFTGLAGYATVIFSCGQEQTVDINLASFGENNAVYLGEKEGNKYTVGFWNHVPAE